MAYSRRPPMQHDRPITSFIRKHYRHFNAAALVDAAEGYNKHLAGGGKMLVTLAGAMSTAELGLSLAEMIRQGKIHAICCTGANLEEDVFNLVAHDHYERVPHYRQLTPHDEKALLDRHMNRVTDTCIPEMEAMRRIEDVVLAEWVRADQAGERLFPHEFFYKILLQRGAQGELPDRPEGLVVAGGGGGEPADDRAGLGGLDARQHVRGARDRGRREERAHGAHGHRVHDVFGRLVPEATKDSTIGFFQIGGGIAGDFPICVVPMLHQDLRRPEVPLWAYFCQISDSTTSYGSYSGAVPGEKITWGKLGVDTPGFIIESDATIVAPLVFAYVLGW
jgi:deoxyhypusine synthase